MSENSPGVTIGEAVAILNELDGRLDVSEWKFRYAARGLGLTPGRRGATQLYDVGDLVLVRLLLSLEAEGLTSVVARHAVIYAASEVRALIAQGEARDYVLMVPVASTYPKVRRGGLVRASDAAGLQGVRVALRDALVGLDRKVAARQRQKVNLWGRKVDRASTAAYQIHSAEDEQQPVFYTIPAAAM